MFLLHHVCLASFVIDLVATLAKALVTVFASFDSDPVVDLLFVDVALAALAAGVFGFPGVFLQSISHAAGAAA